MEMEGSSEDSEILLLRQENKDLRTRLKNSESVIEQNAQELHSLRTQVKLLTDMQNEYQNEIDALQKSNVSSSHSLGSALQQLKDTHATELQDLERRVECLETQLSEQETSHSNELAGLKQANGDIQFTELQASIESLNLQLNEARSMQEDSLRACQHHQELNRLLRSEKIELQQELQNTKDLLEVSREKLVIAKSEYKERSEAYEELQLNFVETQNQLAALKLQPSDPKTRGNSLFAEVEDHRQTAVKRYTALRQKYKKMEQDYSAKTNQIAVLKKEIISVTQKWKEEMEERDRADVWLKDNLQIRIKELQDMVTHLKNEEHPVFITGDTKILKFADHVVAQSRKKTKELLEEMERRSVERLDEADALHKTRIELQSLKACTECLKMENQILKDKLENSDVSELPPPAKLSKLEGHYRERSTLSEFSAALSQVDVKTDLPTEVEPVLHKNTQDKESPPESSKNANFSVCSTVLSKMNLNVATSSQASPILSTSFKLQNSPSTEEQSLDMEFAKCQISDQNPCSTETKQASPSNSNGLGLLTTKASDGCAVLSSPTCDEMAVQNDSDLPLLNSPHFPKSPNSGQGALTCSKPETSAFSKDYQTEKRDFDGEKQVMSEDIFIFEKIATSRQCPVSDTKTDEKENTAVSLSKQTVKGTSNENVCLNAEPPRSILTSSFRSCLVDSSNMKPEKKVCFSVTEASTENSLTDAPLDNTEGKGMKKKVPKVPPSVSYKRNYIISEET